MEKIHSTESLKRDFSFNYLHAFKVWKGGIGLFLIEINQFSLLIRCRERLSSQEKKRENNNFQNYQDRVIILDTKTNKWSQGPSLNTRRRNHGCTLGDFNGRHVSSPSNIIKDYMIILGHYGCWRF